MRRTPDAATDTGRAVQYAAHCPLLRAQRSTKRARTTPGTSPSGKARAEGLRSDFTLRGRGARPTPAANDPASAGRRSSIRTISELVPGIPDRRHRSPARSRSPLLVSAKVSAIQGRRHGCAIGSATARHHASTGSSPAGSNGSPGRGTPPSDRPPRPRPSSTPPAPPTDAAPG